MASGRKNKKSALIIAISVIAALIVAVFAILLSKDTAFYYAAKSNVESGDFVSAGKMIEKSEHKNAEILEDYINLRLEINRDYPLLISEFDKEKIEAWSEKAKRICENSEPLGTDISYEAENLSRTLSEIVSCEKEYVELQADILEMMDVFNEINRLHTKASDGKNVSFTVFEERAKISSWTHLSEKIFSYVSRIPGNENIYLLNYMIKEAQGEISELSAAIDSVAESGYAETDLVRFSGDAVKMFPDITNSDGDSVNLLEKENYERFMYEELCRVLVQKLAVFYIAE